MKKFIILLLPLVMLAAGCSQTQNAPETINSTSTTTIRTTTTIIIPGGTATTTTTTVTTAPTASTTTTSTTTSTTTTTIVPANVVLKGEINMQDTMGGVRFLGEVQNIGGANASYVNIYFTIRNTSGLVIDVAYDDIIGSVLLSDSSSVGSCLRPGEDGVFEVWTSVATGDVGSYDYCITWGTGRVTNPVASPETFGLINDTYNPYSGIKKYLGEIKNNGSKEAGNVSINFILKNSLGKVIDVATGYASGMNMPVGSIRGFEVEANVQSTEVSSYGYKFQWIE